MEPEYGTGNGPRPFWAQVVFVLACATCLSLIVYVAWQFSERAIPAGRINAPSYAAEPQILNTLPEYRFAVHPLHNPQRLFANFQPVIDIINAKAKGFSVRLIAARDYGSFEKRLAEGEFDFALANPLQALYSLDHGYRLVAKMGDDDQFRGLIISRRDSGIAQPNDLRGRTMIFPSSTALAAAMMPRLFLHEKGLDLGTIRTSFSGSQESAIMNAYLGNADAAGTWPMPWELFLQERPELARELQVVWKTEPLVNNAIVAHHAMPESHVRQLVKILLELPQSKEGRAALERLSLSEFEATDASSYAPPVRRFLEAYRNAFPVSAAKNPLFPTP